MYRCLKQMFHLKQASSEVTFLCAELYFIAKLFKWMADQPGWFSPYVLLGPQQPHSVSSTFEPFNLRFTDKVVDRQSTKNEQNNQIYLSLDVTKVNCLNKIVSFKARSKFTTIESAFDLSVWVAWLITKLMMIRFPLEGFQLDFKTAAKRLRRKTHLAVFSWFVWKILMIKIGGLNYLKTFFRSLVWPLASH